MCYWKFLEFFAHKNTEVCYISKLLYPLLLYIIDIGIPEIQLIFMSLSFQIQKYFIIIWMWTSLDLINISTYVIQDFTFQNDLTLSIRVIITIIILSCDPLFTNSTQNICIQVFLEILKRMLMKSIFTI